MPREKVHELSDRELSSRLEDLSNELRDLRFKKVVGQVKDNQKIRNIKRDIARIKTRQRQTEIALKNTPSVAATKEMKGKK